MRATFYRLSAQRDHVCRPIGEPGWRNCSPFPQKKNNISHLPRHEFGHTGQRNLPCSCLLQLAIKSEVHTQGDVAAVNENKSYFFVGVGVRGLFYMVTICVIYLIG